ncbi:MAG: ATP-binding cassette domain-containing protein [Pseudomonadota bacterium]
MSLIRLQEVEVSVGGPPLLDGADLTLEPGERIAVVGRNGAGKSTLLRVLEGTVLPESGAVVRASAVRVASLPQEVPASIEGRVFDVVADGLGELGPLLSAYHELLDEEGEPDEAELAQLHDRVEAAGGWSIDQRVSETLSRLELPAQATFASLSGGLRRRVLLARALVTAPDVLLLDEPTNHLDIEAIEWLEGVLMNFPGALVFVTHDRRFLRALATRIVEIDRGGVTSWPGDYANYLRRRDERLHAEALADARFDKRLASEEVWIRQGIKARRTRNEGRVRALEAMRRERAARREAVGKVEMKLSEAGRSGRKVIVAEGVAAGYDGRAVLQDIDTTVLRGDRVAIIGPNGSGKTTLLRTLLGELAPIDGEITLGTGIELAYFDQHRDQLREDWTAAENVGDGREFVTIAGQQRHVLGYLQEFLFTPERARAPITRLSGGERNRLLLARLFARPFNLLVLDEPTNDLDVETLELLEERLAEYGGTLLLVSHDRDFIDAVVTSTLAIRADGRVEEFVGGYADWERQRSAPKPIPAPDAEANGATPAAAAAAPKRTSSGKLSYKYQRELDELPARIEQLENEVEALSVRMAEPEFYRGSQDDIVATQQRHQTLSDELEACFGRWETLEAMRDA